MKRLLVLTIALLLPLSATAATYSWTDASGTMHFTDDLGAVPKKYRAKAIRQAGTADDATTTVPEAVSSDTKPGNSSPEAQPTDAKPATAPAPVQGTVVGPATRFGEQTAAEWQQQFRTLRAELQDLGQKLDAAKREVAEGKMDMTRQQLTELNARNKQLYTEYEATRLRFNKLVEQANKVGLPPEFAQ